MTHTDRQPGHHGQSTVTPHQRLTAAALDQQSRLVDLLELQKRVFYGDPDISDVDGAHLAALFTALHADAQSVWELLSELDQERVRQDPTHIGSDAAGEGLREAGRVAPGQPREQLEPATPRTVCQRLGHMRSLLLREIDYVTGLAARLPESDEVGSDPHGSDSIR